jgi:hypothetical protein
MDKVRAVLDLFCRASRAKINWGKWVAIWTGKGKREWEWGWDVGLRWIREGEGICYLGIQIGFQLPIETNFDKLMLSLKGKLIAWGHRNLFLVGRIMVANQVLFASMWYLVACWNPNPRMCGQIRKVICNFIWGGKVTDVRPKSNGTPSPFR